MAVPAEMRNLGRKKLRETMKMFEERILRDGKCLPGGVLKVDGFINHQMDPALMMSLARELARRFGGEPLDRVLTVEASGIAPAVLVGYLLGLPDNDDMFDRRHNRKELEHKELMELLRDKDPAYYYTDILVPNGRTLSDFINRR